MGRRTEPIESEKQLFRLLDYLEENDTLVYVLTYIMLYTGFRIGDVIDLTVREIKGDTLVIEEKKTRYLKRLNKKDIRNGKKRPRQPKEPREIELHPDLKRLLKDYTYGKQNSEYLFPSPRDRNKPISYSQVNRRLKEAGCNVGIYDISTHTLRKTSISMVYEKDNDLAEAQNYAGHVSPTETAKYLGLTKKLRQRSVRKMDNLTQKRKNRIK